MQDAKKPLAFSTKNRGEMKKDRKEAERAKETFRRLAELDGKERAKILRRIVTAAPSLSELLTISKRQQYYYGLSRKDSDMQTWRNNAPCAPEAINLLCLLAALDEHADYMRRQSKKASDLVAKIKDEKRKSAIRGTNKGSVAKRLRVFIPEIRALRQQEGYSWAMVAKYLYTAHRKALEGKKVSADYIRRVYQKLESET